MGVVARRPRLLARGGPAISLLKRDDLGQFDAVVEILEVQPSAFCG